jgi:pimeloyl-ACP methyl ester carboxylesterase
MTGYLLPTAVGPRTCIPFSTVGGGPPAGYEGDFYVDAFNDVQLRARWLACKKDKACHDRVFKAVAARRPPNREYRMTDPRDLFMLGKVPGTNITLKSVRRPAFFAQAPYNEAIAALDRVTHTVEFTAPADTYERLRASMTADVKIRGWYLRGAGIDNGRGGRTRSLIIMTAGGGGRIAAITHPHDQLYAIRPDGTTKINPFPNHRSGGTGQAMWRDIGVRFQQAGFDVLLYDRRGVGISTGFADTNTLQQGRDILRIVASLRSGEGFRALTPGGRTLAGAAAARAVRAGGPATMPVLLFGNSRGTMSTGWAMTMNFDKNCSYDEPQIVCRPPIGDRSIKGALLTAEFTSGPGFVMDRPSEEDEGRGLGKDRPLFIGGNAIEHNLVFFPSSAILAGIHKWPAAFFARGLWDYAAALEGTVESYSRVRGPKELVVVRGPHPYEVWPAVEQERVQQRLVAFATAVIQGRRSAPGARPWATLKQLVATSSDVWEPSTKPTVQ